MTVTVEEEAVQLTVYRVTCSFCGWTITSPDYHHAHDLRLAHEQETGH